MGNRQCSIQIENKTSVYTLCNPHWYTHSGHCETPLPPTIDPSGSGSGLFTKTSGAARGAVGVFTYDLLNGSTKQYDGKLAVMFDNPYDFNLSFNSCAVGVFDMTKKCDADLHYQMAKETEAGFVRGKAADGSVTYKSNLVTITATMSDSYEPVIKVQVFNL